MMMQQPDDTTCTAKNNANGGSTTATCNPLLFNFAGITTDTNQGPRNVRRPVCSQCRIRESDLLPTVTATTSTGATASGHAKMLRCARCRVAHYCSVACQKKHFGFHKQSCRSIATEMTRIQQLLEQAAMSSSEEEDDEQENGNGEGGGDLFVQAATRFLRCGDLLVQTGYRETDTIENGGPYYRQALQQYCNVRRHLSWAEFYNQSSSSCDYDFAATEDKILLLLAILDSSGDASTIQDWLVQQSQSPRGSYYKNENDTTTAPGEAPSSSTRHNEGGGLVQDDTCFQMISLLVSMKRLLQYRNTLKSFNTLVGVLLLATKDAADQDNDEHDNNNQHHQRQMQMDVVQSKIFSFLLNDHGVHQMEEALPAEIRQIVRALQHDHGKGDYLTHLRDRIPLQPRDAPDLFFRRFRRDSSSSRRSSTGATDDDVHDPGTTTAHLREFWFLYQDAFFLTPGLASLLHEFVPEEEHQFIHDDGEKFQLLL